MPKDMDDLLKKGIVLGSQVGFLDFTPEYLDMLICKDPITDHFEVEHTPFARGKFAAVRRVRCLRTGEYYAAKVVRRRRRARDVRHETLHEAAVLSLARGNPKIISLHKVFETPSEMTLILELAAGGELQRVIDEEEKIEERIVRKYLTHILTALRFLHDHSVAHLDLKPQNILLTAPEIGSDVKLCDFGIARVIHSDVEVREVIGTPDYVAPEILQYEPISLSTDMWSVGVLSYVLLTGHSPFGGDTKQETFLNISRGHLDFPEDLFEGVTSLAKDFISKLLVVEPEGRLNVEEAILHPWLSLSSPQAPKLLFALAAPNEEEVADFLHGTSSLKRSSSSKIVVVANKENNKNILNSPKNEIAASGSSPPSKRECRDHHTDDTNDTQCHRSTAEVCLAKPQGSLPSQLAQNSLCNPVHLSSPKSNIKAVHAMHTTSMKANPKCLQSPKGKQIYLQSPHSSPKQCRSPVKDRVRVCSQIKNLDLKLRKVSSTDEDALDSHPHQPPSVASLKAKFSGPIGVASIPAFRRNNLNKSFGSVDQNDTKGNKDPKVRLSPVCLRRSENSYHCHICPRDKKYGPHCPREKKYGPHSDFQDLVIKDSYIY